MDFSSARPPWNIPASPPKRKTAVTWSPSGPQLQAQLSRLSDWTRLRRLKNTLLSKGAWQQVVRIQDLCRTHVSHKWLHHLDARAGSVLDAARLHHQRPETAWQQGVDRFGSVPIVWFFLGPTTYATRGHCACVHAVLGGLNLADPGTATEPISPPHSRRLLRCSVVSDTHVLQPTLRSRLAKSGLHLASSPAPVQLCHNIEPDVCSSSSCNSGNTSRPGFP